jgi:hypothetical protein
MTTYITVRVGGKSKSRNSGEHSHDDNHKPAGWAKHREPQRCVVLRIARVGDLVRNVRSREAGPQVTFLKVEPRAARLRNTRARGGIYAGRDGSTLM